MPWPTLRQHQCTADMVVAMVGMVMVTGDMAVTMALDMKVKGAPMADAAVSDMLAALDTATYQSYTFYSFRYIPN